MAETGEIILSRKDIRKEIAKIYLLKEEINLEHCIRDTPEELWESGEFEEQYEEAMTYFDIEGRMELLNDRIEILQDWNTLLSESAVNVQNDRLELAIVGLMIIEVVTFIFALYKGSLI